MSPVGKVCLKVALFYTWGLAWFLDTLFTIEFVSKHGLAMEANPVMHWVIGNWGLHVFGLIKMAILICWARLYDRAAIWAHTLILIPTLYAAIMGGIIVFKG